MDSNYSENDLQTLVAEAKGIIKKQGDLNVEKENLSQILERVDYLLGKYDDIYDKFSDVFLAMGKFDFSTRLPFYEDGNDFLNFIVSGINVLNDEFQANAVNKIIYKSLIQSLAPPNSLIAVTNSEGSIQLLNTNVEYFNPRESTFKDQGIHVLFSNFEVVEEKIKETGSIKNIEAEIKLNNQVYPGIVDVTICNTKGRIEYLIYVIKL